VTSVVLNPGRLRFICASLGAVAERRGCTFVSSLELDELRDLGTLRLFPATGRPQSALFGLDLLLLSQVEAGLWLCDGEHYADYRVTREPELDRFQCDVDAEGVF
jgi:hypothetical protein